MVSLTRDFTIARNMINVQNPTPADYVRAARNVLNILQYTSGRQDEANTNVTKIHDLLKMANIKGGIQEPSTGYDLWALDEKHDIDPLNGRSNAQMAALLTNVVNRYIYNGHNLTLTV
jgi:hypothetical protein